MLHHVFLVWLLLHRATLTSARQTAVAELIPGLVPPFFRDDDRHQSSYHHVTLRFGNGVSCENIFVSVQTPQRSIYTYEYEETRPKSMAVFEYLNDKLSPAFFTIENLAPFQLRAVVKTKRHW